MSRTPLQNMKFCEKASNNCMFLLTARWEKDLENPFDLWKLYLMDSVGYLDMQKSIVQCFHSHSALNLP